MNIPAIYLSLNWNGKMSQIYICESPYCNACKCGLIRRQIMIDVSRPWSIHLHIRNQDTRNHSNVAICVWPYSKLPGGVGDLDQDIGKRPQDELNKDIILI